MVAIEGDLELGVDVKTKAHLRLLKSIALRSSGQDQSWRHPSLIFMHPFAHTGQLFRRGVAVAVCGIAQHDDGVKASEGGIRGRSKKSRHDPPGKETKNQEDRCQNQTAPPSKTFSPEAGAPPA